MEINERKTEVLNRLAGERKEQVIRALAEQAVEGMVAEADGSLGGEPEEGNDYEY